MTVDEVYVAGFRRVMSMQATTKKE